MEQPYGAAVIVEWEGETELDMTGALESESWFGSSTRDRERFRQFRHRLPEKIHEHLRKLGLVVIATDYSVPVERTREILNIYRQVLTDNFEDRFVMFGHIGDAHVHTELLPRDQAEWERSPAVITELARQVVAMGGAVGAEHGLGKRKAHLLGIQYAPEHIAAMRAVKSRFDPQGLLGRGTLFA
jgi:FAD/FMN-containing dehydrogenase